MIEFKKIIDFILSLYDRSEGVVPLHAPIFQGNEKKYVDDAIHSTFVSSVGKYVNQLEQTLCSETGAKYAIATMNGTAALHVALLLAGVGADDEVITQPLTFVATANSIRYCYAHPVFIDIDGDTLGMSPKALLVFLETNAQIKENHCINKNSGRTIRACVPMHTFGHPCRIDEIVDICRSHNIPVVEDAAESIGSLYKYKRTGTFGLAGIYSFNGNKTVTCGGGGAIITDDENFAAKSKHLTTTAKEPHPYEYFHNCVGFNYRMPNLNAALACAQMEQLDSFLKKKRKLAQIYDEFFQDLGVSFFREPQMARSNYWLNTVILNDAASRDSFLKEANNAGVMVRPAWRLMSELPMYQKNQSDSLKTASDLAKRIVNIPSGLNSIKVNLE